MFIHKKSFFSLFYVRRAGVLCIILLSTICILWLSRWVTAGDCAFEAPILSEAPTLITCNNPGTLTSYKNDAYIEIENISPNSWVIYPNNNWSESITLIFRDKITGQAFSISTKPLISEKRALVTTTNEKNVTTLWSVTSSERKELMSASRATNFQYDGKRYVYYLLAMGEFDPRASLQRFDLATKTSNLVMAAPSGKALLNFSASRNPHTLVWEERIINLNKMDELQGLGNPKIQALVDGLPLPLRGIIKSESPFSDPEISRSGQWLMGWEATAQSPLLIDLWNQQKLEIPNGSVGYGIARNDLPSVWTNKNVFIFHEQEWKKISNRSELKVAVCDADNIAYTDGKKITFKNNSLQLTDYIAKNLIFNRECQLYAELVGISSRSGLLTKFHSETPEVWLNFDSEYKILFLE